MVEQIPPVETPQEALITSSAFGHSQFILSESFSGEESPPGVAEQGFSHFNAKAQSAQGSA